MKVSREQAARNRARIVEVAAALFKERGYDGVGVADIMQAAGLTHGGFYGHFSSKEALAAEATAASTSGRREIWEPSGATGDGVRAFVRSYLSEAHRADVGGGCAIAALGADVVRAPLPVREAFTAGVRGRIDALLRLIPGRDPAARRRKALTTISAVVGALVLARAVSDPALSDEFLHAVQESV